MVPSCIVDSFLPPSSPSPAVVHLFNEQLGWVGDMFRFSLTLNVIYGNLVFIYPEIIKPLKEKLMDSEASAIFPLLSHTL